MMSRQLKEKIQIPNRRSDPYLTVTNFHEEIIMSDVRSALIEVLRSLKQRILEVEKDSTTLTEQDTRQGLINVLFRSLGWDLSDFNSVKSEFRHKDYNQPVDYAFFNHEDKERPVLLIEAKSLGSNLNNCKFIKQLCTYLGEMGVQWGLLTDGNKYIMYNSSSGVSFEDQKFLTMQIKTIDTEDGLSIDELADKMIALLSRRCLENDEIQVAYEAHVINRHIEDALSSLLTEPFNTLASSIKKEFKEDRVKIDPSLKITQKQIISYLEFIKDEEGRIPVETESDGARSDESVLRNIALSQEGRGHSNVKELASGRVKRITISDLMMSGLVQEGDSWRFEYKGEITWGRITGNGEIEINGKPYPNPSRAGSTITKKSCGGWSAWHYRDSSKKWRNINNLREQYHEKYSIMAESRERAA